MAPPSLWDERSQGFKQRPKSGFTLAQPLDLVIPIPERLR